ncbi:MAG: hypothetical protein Q8T08_04485 [Ignavibacteria bacterium]|nr:hypothetical protein [Ignavibacteria bacterium]
MMKNQNKGFSAIHILIIVAFIALVGLVSWKAYEAYNSSNTNNQETAAESSTSASSEIIIPEVKDNSDLEKIGTVLDDIDIDGRQSEQLDSEINF